MIVASKGAAGVSGAGLAVLAGGLQSHRPELLDGIGLIVGIDRFMSEARAVTNFSGNAVATVVIGAWTKTMDSAVMSETLRRKESVRRTDHGRRSPRGDARRGQRPSTPRVGATAPPSSVRLQRGRAPSGKPPVASDQHTIKVSAQPRGSPGW